MTFFTPETDPAIDDAGASPTPGTFSDYALSPALLDALAERGMHTPTPIQAAAIPAMLGGRDVVGQARTGSGKTLAFSLPLLEAVDPNRASVQALVLAPTRELASQVSAVIADLGATKGVSVALLYGGTSSGPQRSALRRGAQVAVGTPGRILDLIGQGALWLDQARFVVLDEADEMFDQGFAQDVERIMDKTSNSRQTALFSATMPEWVRQTAARYLYDPETIAVDAGSEPATLVPHIAYVVPGAERAPSRGFGRSRDDADMQAKVIALRDLLDHRGEGSTIVFGRTKQGVDALSRQLDRAGYPVGALQGNMTQAERDFVMASFRSGRINILVATNVAARGLDLVGVNLVINVELPESAELLTHRVGRTGRMGRGGQAITLLAGADLARWQLLIRDVTIPILQLPWPGAVAALAFEDELQSESADDQLPEVIASEPDRAQPHPDEPFADEYPVEEAFSMDESASSSPESSRSSEAEQAARQASGRYERPTRRPSRRPASVAPTSVEASLPERARPTGDASDLIARALASVGVTGGTALVSPRPMAAAPVDHPAVREPAAPRPAPAPTRPELESRPSAQSAPPAGSALAGPEALQEVASEPLRGTPRPPWLRSAAERVGRWQLDSLQASPVSASAPPVAQPIAQPPTAIETPVTRQVETPTARPIEAPTERRIGASVARSVEAPAPRRIEPRVEPQIEATPPVSTSEGAEPDPSRPAPGVRSSAIREQQSAQAGAGASAPITPVPRPAVSTLPQVRRRGSPPPVATPAISPIESTSSAAVEPIAAQVQPVAAEVQPVAVEAPGDRVPDRSRIPTVRASRSRPVTPPTVEPAPFVEAAPVELAPEAVAEPASTPEEVTLQGDQERELTSESNPVDLVASETAAPAAESLDQPIGVTEIAPVELTPEKAGRIEAAPTGVAPYEEALAETAPGEVASVAGDSAEAALAGIAPAELAPVVGDRVEDVAPPTRRRTRTSRAAQSESAASEATATTDAATPESVSDAPAPKPRRASSRKAAAKPVEAAPSTEPVAGSAIDGQDGQDDSTFTATGDSPGAPDAAPVIDETPAPANRSRRSGRGRAAPAQTAPEAETAQTAPEAAASDQVDASTTDEQRASEDIPAPEPAPARSRSRRAEPAAVPESAPASRRRSDRTSDQPTSTAGSPRRSTATEETAAPGNRRTPAQRSSGTTGSATTGGSRTSGGNGGQRNRPTDDDDNAGNTGGPANGNSAMARSSRPPVGGSGSYGGAGPRRRPMAAASATRCAACGTPNPKGSTRKYCVACERELAVRSQES